MMEFHQTSYVDFTMAIIKNTDFDRYSAFDITSAVGYCSASDSASINKAAVFTFSLQ